MVKMDFNRIPLDQVTQFAIVKFVENPLSKDFAVIYRGKKNVNVDDNIIGLWDNMTLSSMI